ncbi:hypothetical protein ACHAWC_011548, partial [Mediolabrus comicus]
LDAYNEDEGHESLSESSLSPHLKRPTNKKSRYWAFFSEFDLKHHPDKKHSSICNLCDAEISFKSGTGGLSNHLKFKHPTEFAALNDENEEKENGSQVCTAIAGEVANCTFPGQHKASALQRITSLMTSEKSMKMKHDLEVWSLVRREIRGLKTELAGEEDEDAKKEVERDIKNMKKIKAFFDEQLGFSVF